MNRSLIFALVVILNACGAEAPQPSIVDSASDTGIETDVATSDPGTKTEPDGATSDTVSEPDNGIQLECTSNEDCNDNNPCTTDRCQWGTCYNSLVEGCGEPPECEEHSDCNDNNPCTVDDTCTADGTCKGTAKDCPNGCNPDNGACLPACQTSADCQDNDPCTDNTCQWGTCQTVVKAECCSSQTNSCTEDNNPCTKAICQGNICGFEADNAAICNVGGLPGKCEAGSCWNDTPAGNCYDANPCTDDANLKGACVHNTVCADSNPCTQDNCVANGDQHTCNFEPIANCCLASSDCNDNNDCTVDTCEGLTCTYDDLCLYYDEEVIARQCETDADCTGSEFGPYCIQSGEPGKSLKLCQMCYVGNTQNYGCPDGQMCFWGVLNDDANPVNYFSTYWCEVLWISVCQNDVDCDDGNECTIDECPAGTCQYKDLCLYSENEAIARQCKTDSDCVGSAFGPYCIESGENLKLCQDCYLGDTLNFGCPAGQKCFGALMHDGADPVNYFSTYWCEVEPVSVCQTDADCVVAGLGGYCVADLETGEMACYPCKWDDNAQQVAPGCTEFQPYCMWDSTDNTFGCQSCYSDEQCGNWQHCESGVCQGYGPVYCTFECPEQSEIAWTKAVIWYGANQSVERECGTAWTISQSTLCLWGTGEPTFKFNLTDGVWEWGSGVDTTLVCNYPANIVPDPSPSGTPGMTMGDLGVALVTFDQTCN